MTKEDEEAACCELCDGAYAWELDQIKKIEPFPVKGQLNLFEVAYKASARKLPNLFAEMNCA